MNEFSNTYVIFNFKIFVKRDLTATTRGKISCLAALLLQENKMVNVKNEYFCYENEVDFFASLFLFVIVLITCVLVAVVVFAVVAIFAFVVVVSLFCSLFSGAV